MNAYTISKLAQDAGVSMDRVRQYEQRGLLQACARTAGGYRIYDEGALARLRFAVAAREAELPLEELAAFVKAIDGAGHRSARRAFAALKVLIDLRRQRLARFMQELDRLHETSRRHNTRRACHRRHSR